MVLMNWARIEAPAYGICFVAVFLAVAVWESLQPRRELSIPAERRWRNHGVMLVGGAIATALLRFSPVAVSMLAAGNPFGLLNRSWMPFAMRCMLAVVLLDALQYWIHWSFHRVPLLWRIHEVHHSDPDYDVSTGARFHPLEVFWTQGLRLGAVALLAPPPAALIGIEALIVILNLAAHANASLPVRADQILRLAFITPDMHRIHHSRDAGEQQRNLGQTFSWWDRLFGTYTDRGAGGDDFRTGVDGLEGYDTLGVAFMLREPFRQREAPEAVPGPLAE